MRDACEQSRSRGADRSLDDDAGLDVAYYAHYVSHVIYVEGAGVPVVDKEAFARVGIETIRIYGRRDPRDGGVRYDADALMGALGMILGRGDPRGEKSRRNTLER